MLAEKAILKSFSILKLTNLYRILITILSIVFLSGHSLGQVDCHYSISGRVQELSSGNPLEFSSITIEQTGQGAICDSTGFFTFQDMCPGHYHLNVIYLGMQSRNIALTLSSDTTIVVNLFNSTETLTHVEIKGDMLGNTLQSHDNINSHDLSVLGNKNLADLLNEVIGVRSLKTGGGISKPIIHGLSGNRIAIINHGAVQTGQQWGADHAPEIDPFASDLISVVKGVGNLEYGGNTLGASVILKSKSIPDDDKLHGTLNYAFNSNGLMSTLSSKVYQKKSWGKFRIQGTAKIGGDQRSAHYYLTNTGQRQYSLSSEIEKDIWEYWKLNIKYSLFATQIGVLRGSHLSSLTDLEEAINRTIPFFTEDRFSYAIAPPRQKVLHQMLNTSLSRNISDNKKLAFSYITQRNNRKEFDARRGNRSTKPALDLIKQSHVFNIKYTYSRSNNDIFKSGTQYSYTNNENQPGTGVLALLPDFNSYGGGFYALIQKTNNWCKYEVGGRYDFIYHQVATVTSTSPPVIERFNHSFHQLNVMTAMHKPIVKGWTATANLAFTTRNPEINELYSSGLHQGVSGIEEGNRNLTSERGTKAMLSQEILIQKKHAITLATYIHFIDGYIYLQPEEEFRLTIRGAFPVWTYNQTKARIHGIDLAYRAAITKKLMGEINYSLVRGQDIKQSIPLVNIPTDQLKIEARYSIKNTVLALNGQHVWNQSRLEEFQDFESPPAAYTIFGASCEQKIKVKNNQLILSLRAENLTNVAFRDYLNRQRYFADELGVNVQVTAFYKW